MDALAPRRPRPAQALLGLFVLGQLVFLPSANFCGLLLWAEPRLVGEHPALDTIADVTGRWGQMTGQVQNWRLFAPRVPTQAVFLAVELRGEDLPYPIRLPSLFEPDDPRRYFRPPGSGDRLFHYENRLGWALVAWDKEAVAQRPEEWRQYMADDVRRQWRAIRAYLSWRLDALRREQPDLPSPREVVLLVRLYPTPPLGQLGHRSCPIEMPLARWRPGQDGEGDWLPVEPYDPIGRCFTRLEVSGQ